MKSLRRSILGLPLAMWVVARVQAQETEIEGIRFVNSAVVLGQTLELNGMAIDGILSIRTMAVGLYLPTKPPTVEAALAHKGIKRIQLQTVRDVSSRDLSNSMLDRVRQNVETAEFAANIVAISQLGSVFNSRPKLVKGDVVQIDYNPGMQLTDFYLNGQKIGESIKGEAFFPMLMKIWLGPKVRASTREALLSKGSAK